MAHQPILGCNTKKEALAKTRAIRDKYRALEERRGPHDPHIPLTGEDAEFITNLLLRHPDADAKIGPGIDHHYVARDDTNSEHGWGFRLVRVNGTEVPWSFHTALKAKHTSPRIQFLQALRCEVRTQSKATKDRWAMETSTEATVEVHHDGDWDFSRIANEFIEEEMLDPATMQIERAGVGLTQLVDRGLAARWRRFHEERAQLRIVTQTDHYSMRNRKNPKTPEL